MNKLKKYWMSIILSILCVFCLSSCVENENYEQYQPQQGSMFMCIESYEDPYLGSVKILVDKETRIMYLYYWERGNDQHFSSSITVLYDSKGVPKKYAGVLKDE